MSYMDKVKSGRGDLIKRHEESYQRKDSVSQYGSIFKKIPDEMSFWKCGEGRHEIDVVPFFAGPNVPLIQEGEMTYVLDLWVHQRVGATNDPYVCPTRNFQKPCPICKYIADQKQKGIRLSKEEYGQVAPKRRTIYLVWAHDDQKEEDKGLQLWEVSHFFFEMNVAEISKEAPENGGMNVWSDPIEGSSVMFTRKGAGQDNTKFFGHKFVERRKPIPEDIMEQANFHLDDIVEMHPSYEDIEKAFYGGDAVAEDVKQREVDSDPDMDPTEMQCPIGVEFGKDFNGYEQCDDCPVLDDCKYDYDHKWAPEEEVVTAPTPKTAPTPRTAAPTALPRRRR